MGKRKPCRTVSCAHETRELWSYWEMIPPMPPATNCDQELIPFGSPWPSIWATSRFAA